MGKNSRETEELQRGLSNRHIQLIALGGAIGVGLFYGSSSTIQMAGPSILIAYLIGGIVIFTIMRALGEMAVAEPVSGSFSSYANRYLGPFAGYLTGWTYWFMWVVVGMAEITVVGVYVNYWYPDIPQWVSALVALVIITGVNLLNVKAFGEFEFWFAMIKVVAIIGLIIGGLGMIFFGIGNGGEAIGFENLWIHGGFMPNGIEGLLLSLVMVMFSFGGVELIGITAGEAENPKKSIPSAINNVIWRILIFYIGSLGIMMILYPWNKIGTEGSPFVLVFDQIGIPGAAHIINFVVLTAALSAFNSGMFSTGRMLYNLALQNNGPKYFGKLNKNNTPSRAILFSSMFLLVAVVLNYFVPEKVFLYISSVAIVAVVTSWTIILLTQMKFRKSKTSEEKKQLSFRMPFFPYTSYFALAFLALIIVLMAYIEGMRAAIFVAPVWFVILYIGYRLKRK
ncbi:MULTISPECIES: amino acid permease [unclassified Bacillus (in: firmicutes)]|uniref:amino acid permease n=1 Tax=unclassified Bacillus (in: firmicutes) TaxID=185979 RepID=UPI0008F1CE37|nr:MULTISPECIES: amino acid permease [unclassified Bacillus (in: firmicutes)]SFB07497.1 amino acid/polyamine/organocation transporter, APC superfamily [Bacillus sp. UNCCL13]SFQ87320.1 amino acid/polyamine/organocation transporter, APC superfamily [Bacillus sp. cl95]